MWDQLFCEFNLGLFFFQGRSMIIFAVSFSFSDDNSRHMSPQNFIPAQCSCCCLPDLSPYLSLMLCCLSACLLPAWLSSALCWSEALSDGTRWQAGAQPSWCVWFTSCLMGNSGTAGMSQKMLQKMWQNGDSSQRVRLLFSFQSSNWWQEVSTPFCCCSSSATRFGPGRYNCRVVFNFKSISGLVSRLGRNYLKCLWVVEEASTVPLVYILV